MSTKRTCLDYGNANAIAVDSNYLFDLQNLLLPSNIN